MGPLMRLRFGMDWDDLKFVLAVARHGSLSAAGRALRTTQPTVSRRLDKFERRIGVKLFERDKDGLSPTRSEEHTSELQSLMRISYAGCCVKKQTHPRISRRRT